jgi:hypothetical protein
MITEISGLSKANDMRPDRFTVAFGQGIKSLDPTIVGIEEFVAGLVDGRCRNHPGANVSNANKRDLTIVPQPELGGQSFAKLG